MGSPSWKRRVLQDRPRAALGGVVHGRGGSTFTLHPSPGEQEGVTTYGGIWVSWGPGRCYNLSPIRS